MIDFTPLHVKEKTLAEFSVGLTQHDLRRLLTEMADNVRAIVADATDADVTFLPRDPGARDIVTDETDPWTLGHVIVHATASTEEGAAHALSLARGIVFDERSRYETPWETIKTSAQVMQRINESQRMCLAMLDAWPDVPLLDTVKENQYFGTFNAIARFVQGLGHEDSHLEQLRDIMRQAKAARGA